MPPPATPRQPCWRPATKEFSGPLPVRSRAIDSGNSRDRRAGVAPLDAAIDGSPVRTSKASPCRRIDRTAGTASGDGEIRPSAAPHSATSKSSVEPPSASARITAEARIASRIACAVPSPQIGSKAMAAFRRPASRARRGARRFARKPGTCPNRLRNLRNLPRRSPARAEQLLGRCADREQPAGHQEQPSVFQRFDPARGGIRAWLQRHRHRGRHARAKAMFDCRGRKRPCGEDRPVGNPPLGTGAGRMPSSSDSSDTTTAECSTSIGAASGPQATTRLRMRGEIGEQSQADRRCRGSARALDRRAGSPAIADDPLVEDRPETRPWRAGRRSNTLPRRRLG